MNAVLRSRSFSLPKAGNSEEENEDAVFADDVQGRYAISDGATEGAYSRIWAHQLVKQYGENPLYSAPQQEGMSLQEWLPVFEAGRISPDSSDHLPWYLEKGIERGSYATLLGIAFSKASERHGVYEWDAVAIGDSCLFQVKADGFLDSFPLAFDYDFSNAPVLLSTVASSNKDAAKTLSHRTGVLLEGDRLLLVTDAFAAWIMKQSATSPEIVQKLVSLVDPDSFAELVDTERRSQRLKNDDSSLLVIEIGAGAVVRGTI